MSDITEHGQRVIAALALEQGLSKTAVEQMARAVSRGGGTMAQFDIAELGGSGQWMSGGMTMVGDMFNHGLKARVEGLCAALSNAMAQAPMFLAPQSLGGAAWWPAGLGPPASSGGQNQYRYAYFPDARRIAFDPGNGQPVVILDTLDHSIGGFSQQQSGPGDPFWGVSCSSQLGQFPLSSLPRVPADAAVDTVSDAPSESPVTEEPGAPNPSMAPSFSPDVLSTAYPVADAQPVSIAATDPSSLSSVPESSTISEPASISATTGPDQILSAISRMAELRDAGILTEEEFTQKKGDLLARL